MIRDEVLFVKLLLAVLAFCHRRGVDGSSSDCRHSRIACLHAHSRPSENYKVPPKDHPLLMQSKIGISVPGFTAELRRSSGVSEMQGQLFWELVGTEAHDLDSLSLPLY